MVEAYLGTDVGCRELGFCFQNTWLAMQRLTPMNRHVALMFADEWGPQSSTTVGTLQFGIVLFKANGIQNLSLGVPQRHLPWTPNLYQLLVRWHIWRY
jgi:hypothetical protein